MLLNSIDKAEKRITVVLLQCPCADLDLLIYDKLRTRFKCVRDGMFTIENNKGIRNAVDLYNIQPFVCEKWMFTVNLDNLSEKQMGTLVKGIAGNQTAIFYCKCSKYRTYKAFKRLCEDENVENMLDFYLAYLKRADFDYLYRHFVPKENALSKVLYDFVAHGYSGDIDSVITLFKELSKGIEVSSRKDIVDICGVGSNTIDTFTLSLLGTFPSTQRGLKTVMRNRVKSGVDLKSSYSWNSFYNFICVTVQRLVDLKLLMLEGVVYKSIPKSIPDAFEYDKLSRYQRYIWKLDNIPLSRLLRLYQLLKANKWKSDEDFLCFLYSYYFNGVRLEVLKCQ